MQPGEPRPTTMPARLRCQRWPVNRYYVSRRQRLLYCPIQKVACTSLKVWWAEHEGWPLDRENLEVTNLHCPFQAQFAYGKQAELLGDEPLDDPGWFRFVFVRNPWTRLVSAFLNKFVHWHDEIALQLIDEFRRGLPNRIARQLWSRHDSADRLAPWWLLRSKSAWCERLTFRQFVNHLATCDMTAVNGHWRPQSEFFEKVEFHFIGRFEHLERDFAELNRLLGRQPSLPRINSTTYVADFSTQECVADWPLSRLRRLSAAPPYRCFYTPALAETVGRLYEADVKRFGYEFDRERQSRFPVDGSAATAERRLAPAA
jgi:hypothetical protein